MADTAKSRSAILTLFANNATGAISEQDLRDFVVSVLGEFAEIQITGGSTPQVISGTPAKMTEWLSNGLYDGSVPAYASDQIAIGTDGTYRIDLDISFSATAGKTILATIYKNTGGGFTDAGLPSVKKKVNATGDVTPVHMHGHLSLSATDLVCAYVWSPDGGSSMTSHEAVLSVKRVY